jgi:hypothetical protein
MGDFYYKVRCRWRVSRHHAPLWRLDTSANGIDCCLQLGVQIIDVCLATRPRNGGLIGMTGMLRGWGGSRIGGNVHTVHV